VGYPSGGSGELADPPVLVLLQNNAAVHADVAARAQAEVVRRYGLIGAQLQRLEEPTSSRRIAGTIVDGDVDTRTLRAALEALPRRPDRIVVVGAEAIPPAFASQMHDLDGFVPLGSRVIYLRRESVTLREAELSGGPYLLMLAAVIWHEMAHAEGCDEAQARLREAELWQEYVRSGRVDSGIGLTYLVELRRRR
jgi:hypothetical protein